MVKQTVQLVVILLSSIMLFACANKLEIEVQARLDNQPAADAKVLVDGIEEGVTDDSGYFSKVIKRKSGVEVLVSVIKEAPGYRIEPWEDSFVMQKPQKGMDKYSFKVDFKAVKYFTLVVTEKGEPLEGATVRVGRKTAGRTDEKGEFVCDYTVLPKKGLRVSITKRGYSTWRKTAKWEPGQIVEASLCEEAVVTIVALTDEYGLEKRIKDVVVKINKKKVGKTNAKGVYTYVYKGKPGKKVRLTLSASNYIPAKWEKKIVLDGKQTIKRFFYPARPKPIRVGIYGYVSNTPDEDLTITLSEIEDAVGNNLHGYLSFRVVPNTTLRKKIKAAKLNMKRITTKGWQETRLLRTVDMIILGSVAKDQNELTIETKVYISDGTLVLSQINIAKKDIKKTAKQIARNIIDRFPFEGTIVSVKGDRYRINLGRNYYKIGRGMGFSVLTPTMYKSGKIKGYRDIGTLKVKRAKAAESWAEIDTITKGKSVKIGDKVVRRMYGEEEMKAAKNSFILSAKGGVPPDVVALRGLNVYLNNIWVGTTGSRGNAKIPIRLGKTYDLVLYRHGYQRVAKEVRIDEDRDVREFILNANNSLFKVDSQPSRAEVFIDGFKIGKTPIREGKLVNFGFHNLVLSAGGDYRDWEEVMEFNKRIEDRTGAKKIVFFEDYLKIGNRAEEERNIDAAIQAYSSAIRKHPDYSIIRCRLASLYMDEKNDYDAAIREFENVLSLPENQQLIYKQFAVTYTNLGHAYYEKGDRLVYEDRNSAVQSFAKAIPNLETAKQNIRFFPVLHYDEAVHDTYYYLAISYHKLYLITKKRSIFGKAELAWRDYFDFFPKKLKGNSNFKRIHDVAEQYQTQLENLEELR